MKCRAFVESVQKLASAWEADPISSIGGGLRALLLAGRQHTDVGIDPPCSLKLLSSCQSSAVMGACEEITLHTMSWLKAGHSFAVEARAAHKTCVNHSKTTASLNLHWSPKD